MIDGDKAHAPRRGRRRGRGENTAEIAARRHLGRMLALQVLYEIDLTEHDPEEAIERVINANGPVPQDDEMTAPAFDANAPVPPDVVAQVNDLVRGVLRHRDDLDPIIAAAAPARSLTEQAAIERNVLRLSAYELLYVPHVPPKVAINEGVELAKRFGGENSGKFVNGVLRTVLENHPRQGDRGNEGVGVSG